MATKIERDVITIILRHAADLMEASDIPAPFAERYTKYGVWFTNYLRVVDSEGNLGDTEVVGLAMFSIYHRWAGDWDSYSIVFHGSDSHYLNRKHGLKDVLAERYCSALQEALV